MRRSIAILSAVCSAVVMPLPAAARSQQPAPALSSPDSSPLPVNPLREARALIDHGQFADAEINLRQLLRDDPNSGDAHALLAYTLLRQNKPREALPEYTRAAALEQPTATMLKQVGQAYELLNDEPDADKWSLRAVQLDPKDADAWYGLGRVRQSEQHFADAVSCFQRVLQLAPRTVKAENNMGLAYEGLNNLDAAAAAYEQAIAWQQSEPEAQRSEQPLLNLAILRIHANQLAQAQPLLEEAVRIAPRDPAIHEQLGHLYLQQNQLALARAEFTRAAKLDPGRASFHFLLGQVEKRMGDDAEAKNEFAAAARLTAQQSGQAPGDAAVSGDARR